MTTHAIKGTTSNQTTTRAPGLDGVRALAVLAVMGFHEGASEFSGGFLGVDIFFVLCGFLITDLLVTRYDAVGRLDLRDFWTRRARRLLPPLAVMLVVVTAAASVIEPGQEASLRLALLAAVTYTSNWYQILRHVSYFAAFSQFTAPAPLDHLWSLAIEEQFYLIWPLILWFLLLRLNGPRARVTVILLAAAASALVMALQYTPGGDPSGVYYGTDTHASALLIGAALALAYPLASLASLTGDQTKRLDAAGVAGLAVLAWAIGHFSGNDPAVYPVGLILAALAAAGRGRRGRRPASARRHHQPAAAALGRRSVLRNVSVALAGDCADHGGVPAAAPVGLALAARGGALRRARRGVLAVDRGTHHPARVPGHGPGPEPVGHRVPGRGAPLARPRRARARGGGRRGPGRGGLWAAARPSVHRARRADQRGGQGQPAGPGPRRSRAGGHARRGHRRGEHTGRRGPRLPAPPPGRAPQRPPAARRPTPSAITAAASPARATGSDVFAVGDSVMLASAVQLASALPGISIDAQVGRQVSVGLSIVARRAAAGTLRPVVVFALGTNGTFTSQQMRQLVRAVGPHRDLVLVNTYEARSWEVGVNRVIAAAARRYPNVVMANWFATIEHRTSLLWPDEVHPQPSGARLYARMVAAAVQAARTAGQADPATASGLPPGTQRVVPLG